MNELTAREHALELHSRIQMYAAQVQDSIYNIGKCMVEMRDMTLYKELGYDTFEEYSRKEFNLGNTQASKFISVYRNLGEEYIKSNAQLGVSKLYLLSQLTDEDREEIETEAADCSFSELQKKIKELEAEKEKMQLSIFDLESENKELKDRPIDVAVQEPEVNSEEIENIKAGYEAKLKNLQNKLEEAQSDNKKASERITKLEEDAEQYGIIAEAQEKQKIKIKEDYDAEVAKLKADYEEKIKEANQKVEEANQKIEESTHVDSAPATADNETVFTMLVKNLVSNLNQFADFLDGISEADEKELYKGKIVSVLEKIKAKF